MQPEDIMHYIHATKFPSMWSHTVAILKKADAPAMVPTPGGCIGKYGQSHL